MENSAYKEFNSKIIGNGALAPFKIELLIIRKEDEDPNDWDTPGTIIDEWKIDCYFKNPDQTDSRLTINLQLAEYRNERWKTLISVVLNDRLIKSGQYLDGNQYRNENVTISGFLAFTCLRIYEFVKNNLAEPYFKLSEIKHPQLNEQIKLAIDGLSNIPVIESSRIFHADVKGVIESISERSLSTLAAKQYESNSIQKSLFLAFEYLSEKIRDSNELEQELRTLLSLGLILNKTQVCDAVEDRHDTGEYFEIHYKRDQSLLLKSVENENVELVKLLLSQCSNANEIYFARFPHRTVVLPGPLEVAFRNNNQEIIDLLLPVTSPLLVEYAKSWKDRDYDDECRAEIKEQSSACYDLEEWTPRIDLSKFQSLFDEKYTQELVQQPVARSKFKF